MARSIVAHVLVPGRPPTDRLAPLGETVPLSGYRVPLGPDSSPVTLVPVCTSEIRDIDQSSPGTCNGNAPLQTPFKSNALGATGDLSQPIAPPARSTPMLQIVHAR